MTYVESALSTIAKYNAWKLLHFLSLNDMSDNDPECVHGLRFSWHDLKSPIRVRDEVSKEEK